MKINHIIALLLVITGVSLRLLPHEPNFAPIGALALFSGVYFSNKKIAFLIPLAAMLVSDFFLGFAQVSVVLSVYLSFGLIYLIGIWLKKHQDFTNTIGASLLASSTFFVITNFVVWLATPWYTKDAAGLLKCFWLALPFFRNTLLGDLFYAGIFFGSYVLITKYVQKYNLKTT